MMNVAFSYTTLPYKFVCEIGRLREPDISTITAREKSPNSDPRYSPICNHSYPIIYRWKLIRCESYRTIFVAEVPYIQKFSMEVPLPSTPRLWLQKYLYV